MLTVPTHRMLRLGALVLGSTAFASAGCATQDGGDPGDGTSGRSTAESTSGDDTNTPGSSEASSGPDSDGSTTDVPASTGAGSSSGPGTRDVPVVIDFDDLPSLVAVTTQYAEYVTFSSEPGSDNETQSGGYASSAPNFICASAEVCRRDTYLDFTHPVSELSLTMVGACNGSVQAHVFVDGSEAEVVELNATSCSDPIPFDLSQFENVTRLELTDISEGSGVGWDDFGFVAHVAP